MAEELLDNETLDQAVWARACTTPVAELLLADGQPVVALDGHGHLLEYSPDGTCRTLG